MLSVQGLFGDASRSTLGCGPGAAASSAETSIAAFALHSVVHCGFSWGSGVVLL